MRTRSVALNFRVEPEKRDAYKAAAEAEGKSLTEWFIDLCDAEVVKQYWRDRKLSEGAKSAAGR